VSIQLTPVPGKTTDADLNRAAKLVGSRYAAGSKEKKPTPLIAVQGAGVRGYLSAYTDAADDPGEFRYVAAGVLACGEQALAVTVLYNDKESPDHTAAMDALKTLSIKAPGGDGAKPKPVAAGADGLRAASVDGRWTLVVPGKWKIEDDRKNGKSRQMTATSADGGLFLSLFLEPAAGPGDAKAARAFYLKRMRRNPDPMRNLKQPTAGEVAALEYDQGPSELKQHHLNAYLAHGGVWVDVHVSKVGYDETADRAAIDALVKGIKIEQAGGK
jgi:hypothetical protein